MTCRVHVITLIIITIVVDIILKFLLLFDVVPVQAKQFTEGSLLL